MTDRKFNRIVITSLRGDEYLYTMFPEFFKAKETPMSEPITQTITEWNKIENGDTIISTNNLKYRVLKVIEPDYGDNTIIVSMEQEGEWRFNKEYFDHAERFPKQYPEPKELGEYESQYGSKFVCILDKTHKRPEWIRISCTAQSSMTWKQLVNSYEDELPLVKLNRE
ncbi:hypothetical protein [Bifidobacterium oedipodis]|uniref:Uncharacterized protein n=1 Tax=Bifidobacterium oedipodis TaxID=2675322 RepID=A0A7Y0HSS2_9BIFI|nr:hypothetical protein [Bifidobacterium sp. DSM 109957]NMM93903.1 hypothetical protein [Bifidobacterium sp. DSM 109957]